MKTLLKLLPILLLVSCDALHRQEWADHVKRHCYRAALDSSFPKNRVVFDGDIAYCYGINSNASVKLFEYRRNTQ